MPAKALPPFVARKSDPLKEIPPEWRGVVEQAIAMACYRTRKAIEQSREDDDLVARGLGFGNFLRLALTATTPRLVSTVKVAAARKLRSQFGARVVDSDGAILRSGALEHVGQYGGVLAPVGFSKELLRLPPEETPLAARVREIRMTSNLHQVPKLRQAGIDAPAGGSASTSGVVVSYRLELNDDTADAQRPRFAYLGFEARPLFAYVELTRDLKADAFDGSNTIIDAFRDAIAWQVEYEIIHGTGVGEMLGILNAPATITVSRATAGDVKRADLVAMQGKLLPQSWNRAFWLAHPFTYEKLDNLVDSAGHILPLTTGPDGTLRLLNRPIYFSERVPLAGTRGDIMLVDPSMYVRGIRPAADGSAVEVRASEEAPGVFEEDMIAVRLKVRQDGQPIIGAPFRLADGSNSEVSPFVVLGDAA